MNSVDSAHSASSTEPLPLVVGIGSSHGDDQAGWAAADALATIACEHVVIRKASVPVDLLNWLDQVNELHIVDVCQVEGNLQMLQPVYRWDWSRLPTAAGSATVAGAANVDSTAELAVADMPDAGDAIDAIKAPKTPDATQQIPTDSATALPAQISLQPDAVPTPIESSHGFDVLSVLQLARQLGRLPGTVILWAIPGTCFDAAAELSPQIRQWLPGIAQQIATELHDA